MDFPSSGVSRLHQQGQSQHHSSYRNTPVHHSLFGGPPSSLFGQPNIFGNVGRNGNSTNSGNQFNFPLRSRGGASNNGQYSNFRGNEPVLRQSIFSPTGQYAEQNLNNLVAKSSSLNGQNNHRGSRHNGNTSQNTKMIHGKDKVSRSAVQGNSTSSDQREQIQQQYRIFKRGDTIPGVTGPVGVPNNVLTSSSLTGSESSNPDMIKTPTAPNGGQDTISEPTKENNNTLNGASNMAMTSVGSETNNTKATTSKENQRPSTTGSNTRTTVSMVSEIAKFHGLQLEYRLVKETGPPHAPTFTVNLTLGTEEYQGSGSSIKRAQHSAATDAMEKTSFLKPPARTQSRRNYLGSGNGQKRPNWALIQLTALADEMKVPLSFALQPMPIVDPFYRREPPSVVAVHVGGRNFTGEGHTFNAAKNTAAMIALKTLVREKQEMELTRMLAEGTTPFQLEEKNLDSENKSPISVVHEMSMKRGLTVSFDVTNESGPPHMKVFTVQCIVGELQTEGQGSTKQQAKKISSEMMISKLREIQITLPIGGDAGSTLKAMQRGFVKPRITKKKSTPVLKDVDKQVVSPISKLIQIAHTKKYKEPEFRVVAQPPETNDAMATQANKNDRRNKRKKTLFTIEVTVGPQTCQGTGMNKKSAKKAAADAALIALGYGPPSTEKEETPNSNNSISQETPNFITSSKDGDSSSLPSSPTKAKQSTTSPRQIVPGVFVLKSSASPPSPPLQSSMVAQELIRVNNSACSGSSAQEGVDKLNYLAQLLGLKVSFSDFPKKDEYLSVVSFGATPPHVAHGIGPSLEEARNSAAQKILDELADLGLDSVTNKAEVNVE